MASADQPLYVSFYSFYSLYVPFHDVDHWVDGVPIPSVFIRYDWCPSGLIHLYLPYFFPPGFPRIIFLAVGMATADGLVVVSFLLCIGGGIAVRVSVLIC